MAQEGAPRQTGYCQVQVLRVIWSLEPHGLTACQDLGRSKVCNARDVADQERHNVLPLIDQSEPAASGPPQSADSALSVGQQGKRMRCADAARQPSCAHVCEPVPVER